MSGLCPQCLAATVLAPPAEEEERPRMADYEILERLGRGGCGVVFRARDPVLGREVALKTLPGGEFAGGKARARLRQEAMAAARLRHPGIVPVYEIGEEEGAPFFTMEFINGRNLAELTRDRPLAPEQAARCVRATAEAVHHAHEHGIRHRDLKPSNILLDERGAVRVTDFGLARLAGEASGLTLSGEVLGTPGYLPPEAVRAGSRDAGGADDAEAAYGVAGDVYSLGATLYHLLTGRPPHVGDSAHAVLLQVAQRDPLPPSQVNPAVPRDLETICLKCLAKSPAGRYPTAQALAEEMTRFLEGRPITARRASRRETAWRWCRRNPLAAALALACTLALTGGTGISLWQAAVARQAEDKALAAAAEARAEARRNRMTAYGSNTRLAWQELARGRSPAFLSRKETPSDDGLFRGWEWDLLRAMADPGELIFADPAAKPLYAAQLAPDGRHFAVASSHGEIHVWDTATRRRLHTLAAHDDTIGGLAWHPDSRRLASASVDRTVKIWDALAGIEQRRLPRFDAAVWVVSWHPAGDRLAVGGNPSALTVWDGESGARLAAWPARNPISDAAWSPDGATIARMDSGKVYLLDAENPAAPEREVPLQETVSAVAWHPDGRRLAVAIAGRRVHLFDTRDGTVTTLDEHDEADGPVGAATIRRLGFSRDGARLLTGHADGALQVREWGRPAERRWLAPHRQQVEQLDAGETIFLSCGWDGALRLHQLAPPPPVRTLLDAGGPVRSLAWDADGTLRAVVLAGPGGARRSFPRWRTTPAVVPLPDLVPPDDERRGTWSPDGARLATVGDDGVLEIREAATGKVVLRFPAGLKGFDILWSPDGGRGAVVELGHAVSFFDFVTGRPELTLPAAPWLADRHGTTLPCEWSPDGRRFLMSAGHMCYDTRTGEPASWPDYGAWQTNPAQTVAWHWHPRGDEVALGTVTGLIAVADAATGAIRRSRQVHGSLVQAVRWHPTEPRLVTACRDGAVRILDADTLEELLILPEHGVEVRALAWSVDGRKLATGAADGRIFIWDPTRGGGM